MLKKALASAGIAAAIVSAGAGVASATPADQAPQKDQTAGHNKVCDGENGRSKTWMGILNDGTLEVPVIKPATSVVLGLCQEKDDQGGDQADQGQQGGGQDQGTPGQDQSGDKGGDKGGETPSFPSAL